MSDQQKTPMNAQRKRQCGKPTMEALLAIIKFRKSYRELETLQEVPCAATQSYGCAPGTTSPRNQATRPTHHVLFTPTQCRKQQDPVVTFFTPTFSSPRHDIRCGRWNTPYPRAIMLLAWETLGGCFRGGRQRDGITALPRDTCRAILSTIAEM